MGEHELGVVPAPAFPVCRAVAASSAFPPVFPPLRLDATTYAHAAAVEYVTLTDGGVYDNMGINPLVRTRNALDYVIVSDGGKPFALDERPTESGAIACAYCLVVGFFRQRVGLGCGRLRVLWSVVGLCGDGGHQHAERDGQ